jgi:hypothetical protein
VAAYPDGFRAAFLGVQAASDVHFGSKMRRHLATGATPIVTTALLRRLGRDGMELAGMNVSATSRARWARAA